MPKRTILIQDDDIVKEVGFVYICAGYLVENGTVLLVHHNGFDKWVPPGGHIEPGETFAATVVREVKEETSLAVEVISSQPSINPGDKAAIADPVPFYVDVEYDFKPYPAIVQFFWVRRTASAKTSNLILQAEEIQAAGWFDAEELKSLATFKQVQAVATYALTHHPDTQLN